jgi:predicted nucleic acid-binding Zn ribbon protein
MERPVKKCPHCGKRTAKRLIGAGAGFIFKGSGFYQTDYRSEEYKSKAKADSATATASTKTDTSAESKPSKKTKDKAD